MCPPNRGRTRRTLVARRPAPTVRELRTRRRANCVECHVRASRLAVRDRLGRTTAMESVARPERGVSSAQPPRSARGRGRGIRTRRRRSQGQAWAVSDPAALETPQAERRPRSLGGNDGILQTRCGGDANHCRSPASAHPSRTPSVCPRRGDQRPRYPDRCSERRSRARHCRQRRDNERRRSNPANGWRASEHAKPPAGARLL